MNLQDIHFFIFDGLSDWEAAYAIAGINSPQYQRDPGNFRVRTVAAQCEPVTTAGGVRIQPDITLGDLDAADCKMLILPGGKLWDEGKNMEVVEKSKSVLASGAVVAAICGATAGLARGGMLDDRAHTSNSLEYLKATHYKGERLYQNTPAVTDGPIITASATAPIEFAVEIFRYLELYSPEVLAAWYGLFKTGKPEYFAALTGAAKR